MAAAPALATVPNPSVWFEPADARNSNWIVRGPGVEAGFSSGAFSLAGRSGNNLDVRLDGASGSAVIQGEEPLSARSFYFHGNNQKTWRGAQHFRRIRAKAIYPGIDAVYYNGPHGLEADFAVSPGADLSRIRMRFEGRRLALDRDGNLCDKSSREVLMAAPAAWQGSGRNRQIVHGGFRLLAPDRVAFRFDRWDRTRTLLIDPTLTYATYFGGSGRDIIVGVEAGADGRFYVAGNTTSVDLPLGISLNSPLIRPISLPVEDTFVACYNADGSLAYVVYVGGNGQDLATSLALDPSGRPTVAGYSKSADFPTTPGAYSAATSNPDAFVYRVSSDGSTLEYSTFLRTVAFGAGLSTSALTFLVSVDASGAATIGGTATTFTPALSSTAFVDVGPAATPGAYQSAPAGGNDIFLMRIRPDGTGVQWATYFGGTHDEALTAMTLDAAGDVIVAGTTNSNDLPLVSPFQSAPPTSGGTGYTYSATTAGFFAKFAPDGKSVAAASYLGGQTYSSYLNAVAIDDTGGVYLGGTSQISAAPGLTAIPGPASAYTPLAPTMILKLDPTATAKQYFLSYGTLAAGTVSRIRVGSSHQPCILTNFGTPPAIAGALPENGYSGAGFACLGADGATVLLATLPPSAAGVPPPSVADFALAPNGTLIGAANLASGAPVTANAPQPAPVSSTGAYVFEIQPQNPTPQLNQISPSLIFTPLPGSSSLTALTLLGSGFVVGETVLWNGMPVSLTNLSGYSYSTSISGNLSAAALNALPKGDVQIQISLPGPGGGVSNPLTLKYVNPAPGSIVVTPQVVSTGSGPVTFTVTGGLTSDCSITWNGAPQTLVAIGSSGFQFTVPASAFSVAGAFAVVATNPAPGGGSATAVVTVTATGLPAPTPTGAVVVGLGQGGATQTLTVNFAPDDAVVVWNGNDRPTSRQNSTTLQFILTQNDLQQMGAAQFQIRSGGVLSPTFTAYVGLPLANSHVLGDPVRAMAYLAGAGSSGALTALLAVRIPSGQTAHSLDLGSAIQALFLTDDNAYLWVTTLDGRVTRVNPDTFAADATATLPGPLNGYSSQPAAIPVPGTSSTIVAAGTDGVLRIFDSGVQRGFSSADLYPAVPAGLTPLFATPNAVWAETGINAPNCFVRLTWDYTGFSGFAQTCANNTTSPWQLPSPELKMDAGVSYFQSGLETLVWSSPRTGYVDFAKRRILSPQIASSQTQSGLYYTYSYRVAVYDLDSETQTAIVPSAGYLPAGSFAPYSESQGLWNAQNMLLIVSLP
jgi:hypothetical protein